MYVEVNGFSFQCWLDEMVSDSSNESESIERHDEGLDLHFFPIFSGEKSDESYSYDLRLSVNNGKCVSVCRNEIYDNTRTDSCGVAVISRHFFDENPDEQYLSIDFRCKFELRDKNSVSGPPISPQKFIERFSHKEDSVTIRFPLEKKGERVSSSFTFTDTFTAFGTLQFELEFRQRGDRRFFFISRPFSAICVPLMSFDIRKPEEPENTPHVANVSETFFEKDSEWGAIFCPEYLVTEGKYENEKDGYETYGNFEIRLRFGSIYTENEFEVRFREMLRQSLEMKEEQKEFLITTEGHQGIRKGYMSQESVVVCSIPLCVDLYLRGYDGTRNQVSCAISFHVTIPVDGTIELAVVNEQKQGEEEKGEIVWRKEDLSPGSDMLFHDLAVYHPKRTEWKFLIKINITGQNEDEDF